MEKKPEGRGSAPDEGAAENLEPGVTTAMLVQRAQAGDSSAVDALFERHRAVLSHWAHGRLPRGMRDLKDTDDLVQEAMHRALKRVDRFEPRRQGSFLAYLCQIVTNLIRDEARRHKSLPQREELPEEIEDGRSSPVEDAIGSDTYRLYQRALERLPEDQRRAVLMRVELGLSYREIGDELGRPTADAARVLVARGLERLSREMNKAHR
jgi:RNA polymerase sigma-70 factor, ECF subfamily